MWAILLQSKLFKTSAAAAGGSGLVAFVVAYTDMKDKDIREYVDLQNQVLVLEAEHIKDNQSKILDKLEKIDDRLYKLKKEK